MSRMDRIGLQPVSGERRGMMETKGGELCNSV